MVQGKSELIISLTDLYVALVDSYCVVVFKIFQGLYPKVEGMNDLNPLHADNHKRVIDCYKMMFSHQNKKNSSVFVAFYLGRQIKVSLELLLISHVNNLLTIHGILESKEVMLSVDVALTVGSKTMS